MKVKLRIDSQVTEDSVSIEARLMTESIQELVHFAQHLGKDDKIHVKKEDEIYQRKVAIMKTRLKELFFGGIGGIFVGLFFSMIVSYFYNPAYLPLHPRSPIGHFFLSQHVHVSLIMLYCLLIWFIMGAVFRWSGSFFQRDWSILRSVVSHYGVMILTFALLANLAGFFPREKILSLTLTAVGEFTLIYLIISGAIYYHTYRNIQKINSGLSSKS